MRQQPNGGKTFDNNTTDSISSRSGYILVLSFSLPLIDLQRQREESSKLFYSMCPKTFNSAMESKRGKTNLKK